MFEDRTFFLDFFPQTKILFVLRKINEQAPPKTFHTVTHESPHKLSRHYFWQFLMSELVSFLHRPIFLYYCINYLQHFIIYFSWDTTYLPINQFITVPGLFYTFLMIFVRQTKDHTQFCLFSWLKWLDNDYVFKIQRKKGTQNYACYFVNKSSLKVYFTLEDELHFIIIIIIIRHFKIMIEYSYENAST